MRIGDIGEFSLIERLAEIIAIKRDDILVGIGDDVAVLEALGDELILATMDNQVEGIHFLADRIRPEQLGRRLLAINLSDIAAMGGRAQYALVALSLPAETEVAWVEALYQGLRQEADRFGVAVVGGNMARSLGGIVIDLSLLGRVKRHHLLLRSGACPGDKVLVTGNLGDSAAGLALLLADEVVSAKLSEGMTEEECQMLLSAHFTPTPRLQEASIIAESGLATAMLDISDGLSSDISHICKKSQVGVRLFAKQLPISTAARQIAQRLKKQPWDLALTGGEDFELCFTAPVQAAEKLKVAVTEKTGTVVTIVGEVLPADAGRWLELEHGHTYPAKSENLPLKAGGWQHFGKAA